MHPILIKAGIIEIRWYGFMYAVSLLLALHFIYNDLVYRKVKFVEEQLLNLIFGTFLGGIFFARLYYVLFNVNWYLQKPWEIIAIWHGGLAIHGGILGGILVGYILTKRYKMNSWLIADVASPYVLLGQALGRFGNFMNGDAHGLPTTMPWGMVFPAGTPAGNEFPGQPLHPTMLYEMFINFIFFIVLFKLRTREYKDGYLFCLYLIFYAVSRYIVSFFRADDLLLFGIYNMPHIVSILTIVVAWYFIHRYKLYTRDRL